MMEINNTSSVSNISHPTVEWSNVNKGVYILGVLSIFCTITTNTTLLVCFYRTRSRPWTSFTRQTFSMTISDWLVGFMAIPYIVMEHTAGIMNGIVCFTTYYTFFATQCVTLFHVLGVCVLRNIKIKSVAQQNGAFNDQSSARWVIAPAWIVSLLVIAVPFILWGNPSCTDMLCSPGIIFGNNVKHALAYIGLAFLSSQCLTNIIYLFTCFRFWRITKKIAPLPISTLLQVASTSTITKSTRGKQQQKHTSQVRSKMFIVKFRPSTGQPSTSDNPSVTSAMTTQRRVIGTIGILLLLFNVFTLPLTIKMFVEEPEAYKRDVRYIIASLFLINSAINPIVYATRVPTLREAVIQLLKDVNLIKIQS